MKILVVCQYFCPEDFQINSICERLAQDGNEVTVLTGLPNYPSGIIADEYKHGKKRDELLYGVHVIRCFEIGRKKGVIGLAANYLSYCISATRQAKKLRDDFDIVFIYQLSPVLMAIPGLKYAKKHKVPTLLYCCDLWPESLKLYIAKERNIIYRVVKRLSTAIYSSCTMVACQSNSFLPYMKKTHALPEERLMYLPAFADEQYIHEDFTCENDEVNFVFMGNLGIAQDLMTVLAAIEMMKGVPGFIVHFVGDGSCLEKMKAFVRDKKMEGIVRFYGRRPVEEMPRFYKLADACLVSLDASNLTRLTLPSKVQGYMAAGKPIIGMIDGSAQEIIHESGCGVCVPAGDAAGLANAMRDFVMNKEAYKNCGIHGRAYFMQHFRKDAFFKSLYTTLDKVRCKANDVV